jgi:hypothetical protein
MVKANSAGVNVAVQYRIVSVEAGCVAVVARSLYYRPIFTTRVVVSRSVKELA